MATSQGLRGPPRNWKRQGTVFPKILQWERGPGSTLIEDFWPPELLFSVTQSVETHDSSPRRQLRCSRPESLWASCPTHLSLKCSNHTTSPVLASAADFLPPNCLLPCYLPTTYLLLTLRQPSPLSIFCPPDGTSASQGWEESLTCEINPPLSRLPHSLVHSANVRDPGPIWPGGWPRRELWERFSL